MLNSGKKIHAYHWSVPNSGHPSVTLSCLRDNKKLGWI